ncbi:MAG: 2-oxoacid:ferredoxin oxidoreductase subunit beta [Anaerolineae bacterium]|jgi:2-oxoglutarate ferredoxin oxidoreductase subunit beta|nr:2-oxoacid:ferredoxin oxidoreductase subunit beta [Anaerolineae bacterium]
MPDEPRASDYKSDVKPIWCPGCGDYAVLAALMRAFAHLRLAKENITVASGIGCSSRFPTFLDTYGIHGIHGRVLPLATGIKLGRPETTVIAVGGDGDGFSIGGGHIPHAARRNVDLTYIVMDNNIYGMTKGQPSPTSPEGIVNKAAPYGAQEGPLNPILLALSYDVSFVARCYSGKIKELTDVLIEALKHPGFSLIQVLSPCVTYYNTYDHYREITQPLPSSHDPTDRLAAIALALQTETQYLGIFYRDSSRPSYGERFDAVRAKAPQTTLAAIFEGLKR